MEASIAEQEALQVVSLLQDTISRIRGLFPSSSFRKEIHVENVWAAVEANGFAEKVTATCARVETKAKEDQVHWLAVDASYMSVENDRDRLVYEILLPLLSALGRCYAVLDQLPTPVNVVSSPADRRGKNRPPPPPGMLSLQNYTDVAAAIELTVCYGILPCLETNILYTAQQRASIIPRSLAGRLPPRALSVTQPATASGNRRRGGLRATVTVLGQLLLLDRFRPMLLPRHTADLLAAVLQHDELRNETPDRSASFETVASKLLGADSQLDATLQAKTFQQLLALGRKTPMWLRRAVTTHLNEIACRDLGAVMAVFVDGTSARVRLAHALTRAPDTDRVYYQGLCEQLNYILDRTAALSDLSEAHVSYVETVWAIVEALPDSVWKSVWLTSWSQQIDTEPRVLVLRVKVLWQCLPTWTAWDPVVGYRLLLSLLDSDGTTVLGVLMHWASRLVATQDGRLQEDAVATLRVVVEMKLDGPQDTLTLSLAWIRALVPSFKMDDWSLQDCVDEMERRTRTLIRILKGHDNVTSCLFQTLLQLYFGEQTVFESPAISNLVPMVALPILCESCSMDSLLLSGQGDKVDGDGLFDTLRIVLMSLRARYYSCVSESPEEISKPREESKSFEKALARFPSDVFTLVLPWSDVDDGQSAKDELLVSLSSLLLSLLVSMLELGAETRPESQETTLRSFLNVLRPLAESSLEESPSADVSQQLGQVAEMASHAMALISSRQVLDKEENRAVDSIQPTFDSKMEQAKKDLESSEPPLRARGVVSLRHLASALADESTQSVVLVSSGDSTLDRLLRILSVAVDALRDTESYVYLAAVHTVVAIADVLPSEVIPRLGMALARGNFAEDDKPPRQLSDNQRVKLAESLIFTLRRRASVNEYLTSLLEQMTFGSNRFASSDVQDQPERIQLETHLYFVGERDREERLDNVAQEEEGMRLRAGGPLFASEEQDAVRAAAINVMAELVGIAPPVLLAPYCDIMVQCSLASLQLEASRPVRRAGALLARELYSAFAREGIIVLESAGNASLAMGIAMVAAGESRLAPAIERCIALEDLGDLEKKRVYDPATVARCRESLEVKRELESNGILSAARLAEETSRVDSANPLLRLVRATDEKRERTAKSLIVECL